MLLYLFRLLSLDYIITMTEILSIQQIFIRELQRRGDRLLSITKNIL